ncbi:hypothetical protein LS72_005165 [Helicobacter apodemus]|uniref:Uncharacterized protein n=1 Tax=Helicobacter apodemus TaxID=135569 RepID=A0A4U8UFG8_9HELI|nr:hypothetical protein [Helicobacter apodemus]TLE15950.1 hypothetical protein LS72_005165 [Helicobacter apodemus]
MTKQELDEVLKGLNLTRKSFCEKLGVNYKTMNNHWDTKNPIPQYAISWLEIYKTAQKYEQFIEILKNDCIVESQLTKVDKSFTKEDFVSRLKTLNLTRSEFCEKVGIGYSTPTTWNLSIPLWVEAWLNTYENAENFKKLEILFQKI